MRTPSPSASRWLIVWVLVFAGLLSLTLNNTHPFHGDESYYTVSAAHMVRNGSWMVPVYFGEPRFQKPILTYWLVAAAYKVLGISLWSGRIPILLAACLTLILAYRHGRLLIPDGRFGLFVVLLLSSSFLFIGFSRVAMTDPLLSLFTTATLLCLAGMDARDEGNGPRLLCAWLCTGLAFMTKGPVAFLPLLSCILVLLFADSGRGRRLIPRLFSPLPVGLFLLVTVPWYAYNLCRNRDLFLSIAGREGANIGSTVNLARYASHLSFYLVTMAVFFFPFAIIALARFVRSRGTPLPRGVALPAVFIAVALVFYTFLAADHKDRYLCVVAAPLALLVGAVLYPSARRRGYAIAAVVLSLLTMTALIVFPLVNGEGLRKLVAAWESGHNTGSLGTYGLDQRRAGWVLLLSNGRAALDDRGADFVITDETGRSGLAGAAVIAEAVERSRLTFEGGSPRIAERRFYLVRRSTR